MLFATSVAEAELWSLGDCQIELGRLIDRSGWTDGGKRTTTVGTLYAELSAPVRSLLNELSGGQ